MITRIIIYSTLLASLLFPAYAWAQDFSALKNTGKGTVIEVIDPYTLQVDNGQLIHLTGIHYPDYSLRNSGELSLSAMKVLRDAFANQKVSLYQSADPNLGRVNRLGQQIAHIQRIDNGLWAQGLMLSLGLAVVKTTQRNDDLAETLYMLEEEARREKLGFWAKEDPTLSPKSAAKHLNSFQIIEGRIETVALNKNRAYINFGKNWRDDFTVSIAPESLKIFSDQKLFPQNWGGQTVRVRGWIEEYNGPYIEIDHPEAIEFLGEGQ